MRLIYIFSVLILTITSLLGQYTIKGKVINSQGESLIQASAFLEDTYLAAVSDDKGDYMINNISPGNYILKVSYVGYKSYETEITISDKNVIKNINLGKNILELGGVEIYTNKVSNDAVFAHTNITKEEISKKNLGQDVPYLLRWTPSAVVTSDAGTGIGYTGIRLRGSDATSINVTLNDVPLNDSESQGVFWVDLPDFMSSVDNVQIQRGVGTSTNGAGAFGGTISLNTNKIHQNAYIDINTSYGSFNSKKLSINLGTGLLNNKYIIDARYSLIKSDGYIDRATSDLKSWYFSAAKLSNKSSIRFITFSGKERTYQSWNGTPESIVNGTTKEMQDHYNRNSWLYNKSDSLNLFESGRTYNYYTYKNQVDDYQQHHYQLHYTIAPTSKLKLKATTYYTVGKGYYEQAKRWQDFNFYSLPTLIDTEGDTLTTGNLVRRKWLDNDYYGVILSGDYQPNEKLKILIGGGFSQYKGEHFGRVIKADGYSDLDRAKRYYDGLGKKSDLNIYTKINYKLAKANIFLDLQSRNINQTITGNDDDLTDLDISKSYNFFNPKIGVSYQLKENQNIYLSYAIANREPNRSDLISNVGNDITHETLHDIELGYRFHNKLFRLEWNNYLMRYKNQLVLTGNIDNTGAYIKTNVGESTRLGTELSLTTQLSEKLLWNINTTISKNKIKEYVEDLGQENPNIYKNSNLSFSPALIGANTLLYNIAENMEIELSTKYVGKQYLDNTTNENRKLPAFTYSNFRFGYSMNPSFLRKIDINATVYNIFDAKYSSNGYTYSYYSDKLVTENFLYPQAGMHFILGVNIGL
ncbi:MAG: TonB-dependent receptor [Saprospiraceae bacterium]